MQTGYPDYQRLTAGGGFELATVTGSQASGAVLFEGAVGPWPYLNIATGTAAPSDTYRLAVTYYTDGTYTTVAASQSIVRTSAMSTIIQRAVLGPWVRVTLTTASGNPLTLSSLTVYGTYGAAAGNGLHTGSEVLLQVDQVIAAGATASFDVGTCIPGPAVFMLYAPKLVWTAFFYYYSWDLAAYAQYWQVDNTVAAHGGSWPVPMVDAPHRVEIANGSTAAQNIVAGWLTAAY